VNRRDWYQRVNEAWPGYDPVAKCHHLPALTFPEAARAARLLWRYALGSTLRLRVVETSGNRRTWIYDGELRVNPELGWNELTHDLSHLFQRVRDPTTTPHSKEHARLELRLVRRGWLDGRLKDAPRPAAAAPEQLKQPAASGGVTLPGGLVDRQLAAGFSLDKRVAHAQAMLRRAVTRCRRAETILKKWRRRAAALARRVEAARAVPS